MALQTATPPPRRPLPRSSTQRRTLRVDPPNTFIAGGHSFAREPERPSWIDTADPALAALPVAPLAAPAPKRPLSRKWTTAIAASVALHVAVAAFFLMRGADDDAQVAGGEESGLLLLGNATEDQVSSGEMMLDEATQVTIVPIQDAKPVETVEAEAVQPVEDAETAEPVESIAEAVTAERIQPVEGAPVAEAAPEQTVAEAVPEQAAPAAPAEALPEVLATDTPEIVADDNVAAPVETARQQPIEEVQQTAPAAPEEPVKEAPQDTVEELPQEPTEPETAVAEVLAEMAKPIERPQRVEPKRAEARKPPVEKRAEKPAPKAEQPAKKAEKRAGSGGRNQTDARRGRENGEARGTKTAETGKGKASAAGNAAVDNYPGKVRREISRAIRRVSRRDLRNAERDVHIAFTVTANGGLGGVSIARSSGSSALDNAAVAAVRRAAPFPPIPDGAGRRSWQFSFPLGLVR